LSQEDEVTRQASSNPLSLKILLRLSKKADHLMEVGRSLAIINTSELMNASKKLKDLNLIEQKVELEGRRFYQVTDLGKKVASFAQKEQDRLVKAENKLVEKLWNLGWICVRSPAGATGHTPDIVAIKQYQDQKTRSEHNQDQSIIILRCVGSSTGTVHLEASQIDSLRQWKVCKVCKPGCRVCKAYVAVTSFSETGFSFLTANELGQAEAGVFSVSPETIDNGPKLESLFAQ
jgi:Holliday junction resolvase